MWMQHSQAWTRSSRSLNLPTCVAILDANREASLLGSTHPQADSPGLRASLTYWFGFITLKRRISYCPPKGEWVKSHALIRRILHVWHPALGNGMAFYTACSWCDLHTLLMGVWPGCMHVLRRKEKDFEGFLPTVTNLRGGWPKSERPRLWCRLNSGLDGITPFMDTPLSQTL